MSSRLIAAILLLALFCPGVAQAWWNDAWTLRKAVTVDLATVPPPGSGAVMLVRLHSGNFNFAAAKNDGSDLRFIAADDQTPLAFHIERYDDLFEIGLVWVKLPELKPGPPGPDGAPAPSFYIYFSNPEAPAASDPAGTYDVSNLLVLHFGDQGGPLPTDSTSFANNANASTALKADALIASGISLTGATGVTVPPSGSLTFPANQPFTAEGWVRIDAAQTNAVLLDREAVANDPGQGGLSIGVDGTTPFVEVRSGGQAQRIAGTLPLNLAAWTHLAVTGNGQQLTLYVDGKPAGGGPMAIPALAGGLRVGQPFEGVAPAAPAAGGVPPTAPVGLTGGMDEVRLSNVDRGAPRIQFAAIVENAAQTGVTYGPDEENSTSKELEVFIGIFNAVTPYDWVINGLLGVMLLLSWFVMITKANYLNGAIKANGRFLRSFRKLSSELSEREDDDARRTDVTEPLRDAKAVRGYRRAPAFRVFSEGATDLGRRIAGAQRHERPLTLSDANMAAIRATLDAAVLRELDRCSAGMVVLTIAIAGGPFIGLFGTVVGVMVVFGSIAASGQVNVNAIAPGVAGALVCTAAGLLVAIPALFGYNYLTGRIKQVTTELRVFVEEFSTKLAEFYIPQR